MQRPIEYCRLGVDVRFQQLAGLGPFESLAGHSPVAEPQPGPAWLNLGPAQLMTPRIPKFHPLGDS